MIQCTTATNLKTFILSDLAWGVAYVVVHKIFKEAFNVFDSRASRHWHIHIFVTLNWEPADRMMYSKVIVMVKKWTSQYH